jgi:hypothetical protein
MTKVCAETRGVQSAVGRQMELDKKSCVGLCACELCAVQSSSRLRTIGLGSVRPISRAPSRATSSIDIGLRLECVTEKKMYADSARPIRPESHGCRIYVKIARLRRARSIRRTVPRS